MACVCQYTFSQDQLGFRLSALWSTLFPPRIHQGSVSEQPISYSCLGLPVRVVTTRLSLDLEDFRKCPISFWSGTYAICCSLVPKPKSKSENTKLPLIDYNSESPNSYNYSHNSCNFPPSSFITVLRNWICLSFHSLTPPSLSSTLDAFKQ